MEQHQLASLVNSVAAELAIKSPVHLLVTRHSFGPAVFGLFSPTIILPLSVVRRCSEDQLRTIIGHELVHFRRLDTWMGVVQLFSQIVWWFHPCVWFANRQATLERERCCDAEVLAHLRCDPAVYAQSLLDVLKQKQSLHGLFALPGMKPVEITRRRLSAILDANARSAGRTPAWNWGVASLACLILLPGAGLTLTAVESADDLVTSRSGAIAQPTPGSWPQAGGTSHRNQVTTESAATNWDVKSGENVRWKVKSAASLAFGSSWSHGNGSPVVSGGRVLITGNNRAGLVKRLPENQDFGCLICFDVETGKFLWQHSNPRLPTGRVHDWPFEPISSAPYVDGDRVWYVNNRAEIVCLDFDGFRDGDNDGPYKQEEVEALDEADVIWKYDMMKELGASPHNRCTCSITAAGDLLLIVVPNGVGESHLEMAVPKAPSFIAVHKTKGNLVWQDDSATANTLHAGWGSAAYGSLGGVPQAVFPGGDGWLYSYDVRKMAEGKTELLWKFDCNPKASESFLGGRGTRNELIAAPVIHDGLVYITSGQDPEHGEGEGVLWCLNPTARGDISAELVVRKDNPSQVVPARRGKAVNEGAGEMVIPNPNEGVVWKFDKVDVNGNGKFELEETMHRSVSSVAIKDGLLVATDMSGFVHCLDAKTGIHHWTYDAFAQLNATPLIAANHIYVPDEDGEVAIFKLDKALQLVAEINMESPISSPLVAVGGTLYIQSHSGLAAICDEKKQTTIRKSTPQTVSNWPSSRGSSDNTSVAMDDLPIAMRLQ